MTSISYAGNGSFSNSPSSDISYYFAHTPSDSAVISTMKNSKGWYDEASHASRDVSTSVLNGDKVFDFSKISQTTLLRLNSTAILSSYDTSTRIDNQLNQIASYEDGWLNGEGERFNSQEIKQLAKLFAQYFDFRLTLPTMFASPDQTISTQWIFADCSITLDIDLSSMESECQAYFHEHHDFQETTLSLTSPSDWTKLNDLIRKCGKVLV